MKTKLFFALTFSLFLSHAFANEVKTISMVGCEDLNFVHKNKILPRGSALITSSGDLAKQGITAIVHAGSASMRNTKKEPYNPTLKGLTDAVTNSMILTERFGHKRVAIPFIGGGVFFKKLKSDQDDLAYTLVKTAFDSSTTAELVFLSIDEDQVDSLQAAALKINSPRITVVKGSITDFKVHKASAIVNSANMEMVFGTGVSGVIGKATGDKSEIDAEAKKMILEL